MAGKKFECCRCGNCCSSIKIQFSRKDVERWIKLGRFDVLHYILLGVLKDGEILFLAADEHLKRTKLSEGAVLGASGWYNSSKDERILKCPFLSGNKSGKAKCCIYKIRPQACRNFPLKLLNEEKKDSKIRQCPVLKSLAVS